MPEYVEECFDCMMPEGWVREHLNISKTMPVLRRIPEILYGEWKDAGVYHVLLPFGSVCILCDIKEDLRAAEIRAKN